MDIKNVFTFYESGINQTQSAVTDLSQMMNDLQTAEKRSERTLKQTNAGVEAYQQQRGVSL